MSVCVCAFMRVCASLRVQVLVRGFTVALTAALVVTLNAVAKDLTHEQSVAWQ